MGIRLVERAKEHAENTAISCPERSFTYQDLLESSAAAAGALLDGGKDLKESRVAFLIPASFQYASVQWGIWRAGGIAVPLCVSHPRPELEYVIANSGATILVADPHLEQLLRPIAVERNLRFVLSSDLLKGKYAELPELSAGRRAMILYTSGTTGKPKGVVTTHANIEAQVSSLISSWEWTSHDSILNFLPLHHIHGIINILTCCLWAGGRCEMMEKFDAAAVWKKIIGGEINVFMAVPTIYARLIAVWEGAGTGDREKMTEACGKLRLMVSGSAALPVQILEKWREISGHFLLERYGMTEIGMALSNPLRGQRRAGHVGEPLPDVQVMLADDNGSPVPDGTPGEILVRGPGVFLEYWMNQDATQGSFRDGWFRTGDTAVSEDGSYRIFGRTSVDIIKTGGYKVSALEIEETLRTHPAISDCAVVGVPDPVWGEKVCAALVLRANHSLRLEELRSWAKKRLAVYKVPAAIALSGELPRNAMGKVVKKSVAELFSGK